MSSRLIHGIRKEAIQLEESVVQLSAGPSLIRTAGPLDGQVILCLHGLSLHGGLYGDFAKEFACKNYRVVALDFYGRGGSPWPRQANCRGNGVPCMRGVVCNDELLVQQCVDVLKAIGAKSCALVIGLSLGGGVAVALAARHPSLVQRVCALAPVGLDVDITPDFKTRVLMTLPPSMSERYLLRSKFPENLAQGQHGDFYQLQKNFAKAEAQAQLVRDNFSLRGADFVGAWLSTLAKFPLGSGTMGGSLSKDFEALGLHCDVESKFLWGEEDTTCLIRDTSQQMRLRNLVPRAEVFIYQGIGHNVLDERFQEVCEKMLSWLQGLDDRAKSWNSDYGA